MDSAERPSGNKSIYTPDDFVWLAGKLKDFRVDTLKTAIVGTGLDIEEVEGKSVVLKCGIIKVAAYQDDGKTTLSFLADDQLAFDPKTIYDTFFKDLPDAIYGNSSKPTPLPEYIQNHTMVTLKTRPPLAWKMDLGQPYHKELFEEFLEDKDKLKRVVSVKLETIADDVLPFSLTLPNPARGDSDVSFTFSSRDELTRDTMEVLLGLHKNGPTLRGKQNVYAKAFAAGINAVRQESRVPKEIPQSNH